jgi:pimeloyl-ACP methyl ester carboxylesterase
MNPHRIPYGDDESQFFELWHAEQVMVGFDVYHSRWTLGGEVRSELRESFLRGLGGLWHCHGQSRVSARKPGRRGLAWHVRRRRGGVKAASEHLGGSPVVVGHSAGGHLALRLASEPILLKAVVALAPVAGLRLAYEWNLSNGAVVEFLGGTPDAMPS